MIFSVYFSISKAKRIVGLLVLLLLLSTSDLLAQAATASQKEPWSFGVNGYYGALFRYRSGLSALNYTHPFSVELYANRHTIGKRAWERKYRYPQLGFALSYFNYGVPEELGEAASLTVQLDNALLQTTRGNLRFNLGSGLVYSTRHYITGVNEQNMAIGSKFCFALIGGFRYEHQLSDKLFLNTHFAFRHFSNGGLNKPNNGMNFPLVGVGVRYQPKRPTLLPHTDTVVTALNKRIHLNLKLAMGRREVLYEDVKTTVHSISLYASKRLSQTNSLLLGADAFHDVALSKEYLNALLPWPEQEPDPRMLGITLGHELHFDRTSFLFQFGRYIYQPTGLFPGAYQRYNLKHLVTKNVSAGVALVAHTKRAYVIEWGLGLHL
ncbi:acyloxyacyl hydrolase [Pontibacter qinzhouensis]|uniref:acyloxyacyl hydrolase n=1 Tax=Pontibacter qinzhouensis TaxID=2603253 RepID=UPI0016508C6B|nr:acyloxyacyl hydrolase [Pontibacter qinzhouensis]